MGKKVDQKSVSAAIKKLNSKYSTCAACKGTGIKGKFSCSVCRGAGRV